VDTLSQWIVRSLVVRVDTQASRPLLHQVVGNAKRISNHATKSSAKPDVVCEERGRFGEAARWHRSLCAGARLQIQLTKNYDGDDHNQKRCDSTCSSCGVGLFLPPLKCNVFALRHARAQLHQMYHCGLLPSISVSVARTQRILQPLLLALGAEQGPRDLWT